MQTGDAATYLTFVDLSLLLSDYLTTCYSNGNDSPHRRPRRGRSIVFVRWRQCAPPSNTRRRRFFGRTLVCSQTVSRSVQPFCRAHRHADDTIPLVCCSKSTGPHSVHATRLKCNLSYRQSARNVSIPASWSPGLAQSVINWTVVAQLR